MRAAFAVVFIVSTLFASIANADTRTLPRISQQGRWLIDEQQRVVLLHGGNLLLPSEDRFGPAATVATPIKMAEHGFNAVRLVIFFSRLMPTPGDIDNAYLDTVASTVAAYREAGVYVLLDLHQDEFGPSIGIRGLPEWATFADGHAPLKLQFPAGYFSDPAIQAAFDNFWRNHVIADTGKGVQDFYAQGVAAVAKKFRDEPTVFGIDVMNEPFPGSQCNQPNPKIADCPELEQKLLAPFYARIGAAIAAAAPNTIVLVEPFMLQGALGIAMNTPSPGASVQRGLSFHQYGTLAEIRQRGNRYALAAAQRTQSAILNTEWGFTNDPNEWNAQAQELDDLLIPWLAWARGPFSPLVDNELPAAGNDNREATLRALARPYPRATAGTPLQLHFDPSSGTLHYRYSTLSPDGREYGGVTEIVMPKINFPAGYRVEIDSKRARVLSKPDAPIVRVEALPHADAIDIAITRRGDLPPLPPLVATETPYAFLHERKDAASENGALSTRSLLGDLLGDARAHAILDREIPDLIRSPQIGMGSQMSLRALQAFSPALLTDERLDRIDSELQKLSLHKN